MSSFSGILGVPHRGSGRRLSFANQSKANRKCWSGWCGTSITRHKIDIIKCWVQAVAENGVERKRSWKGWAGYEICRILIIATKMNFKWISSHCIKWCFEILKYLHTESCLQYYFLYFPFAEFRSLWCLLNLYSYFILSSLYRGFYNCNCIVALLTNTFINMFMALNFHLFLLFLCIYSLNFFLFFFSQKKWSSLFLWTLILNIQTMKSLIFLRFYSICLTSIF